VQGRITHSAFQIADIRTMANSGHHADEYPNANHAEPERRRNALAAWRRNAAGKLVLANPERESRNQEAKAHERHRCTNPREKRPFRRQVNAGIVDRPGPQTHPTRRGARIGLGQLYNRLGDRSILHHIHPSTQYGRTVLRVSSVPDLPTVAGPCSDDEDWSKTIPTLEREPAPIVNEGRTV
jgi:hypothetical protein